MESVKTEFSKSLHPTVHCSMRIKYLRDPAFASLDGKESEHGVETVVVVEVLPGPDPVTQNNNFSLNKINCFSIF